jgi:hypothetical protein
MIQEQVWRIVALQRQKERTWIRRRGRLQGGAQRGESRAAMPTAWRDGSTGWLGRIERAALWRPVSGPADCCRTRAVHRGIVEQHPRLRGLGALLVALCWNPVPFGALLGALVRCLLYFPTTSTFPSAEFGRLDGFSNCVPLSQSSPSIWPGLLVLSPVLVKPLKSGPSTSTNPFFQEPLSRQLVCRSAHRTSVCAIRWPHAQ